MTDLSREIDADLRALFATEVSPPSAQGPRRIEQRIRRSPAPPRRTRLGSAGTYAAIALAGVTLGLVLSDVVEVGPSGPEARQIQSPGPDSVGAGLKVIVVPPVEAGAGREIDGSSNQPARLMSVLEPPAPDTPPSPPAARWDIGRRANSVLRAAPAPGRPAVVASPPVSRPVRAAAPPPQVQPPGPVELPAPRAIVAPPAEPPALPIARAVEPPCDSCLRLELAQAQQQLEQAFALARRAGGPRRELRALEWQLATEREQAARVSSQALLDVYESQIGGVRAMTAP